MGIESLFVSSAFVSWKSNNEPKENFFRYDEDNEK